MLTSLTQCKIMACEACEPTAHIEHICKTLLHSPFASLISRP